LSEQEVQEAKVALKYRTPELVNTSVL